MSRIFISTTTLVMIYGLITSANAELIDRGGGMIYDTAQNITWLQNANFCGTGTNYLSNPACVAGGAFSGSGNPPMKGGMYWDGAQIWAQNLVYGGFDDWRLPTTDPLDGTCSMPQFGPGVGFNCQNSEMGHLYYVDGITLANPGILTNIPISNWHWSNEYSTDLAWTFQFNNGFQTHFGKNWGALGFAWAVRDGDVTPPSVAVKIDIKPGSFPNSINPNNNGVIPVAILSTGPSDNVTTFDATTVARTTVHFGSTGTEASPVHDALEDVDGDGDIDMILQFKTKDTGIICGNTSATLTGETFDEQAIKGTDSIKTPGCK